MMLKKRIIVIVLLIFSALSLAILLAVFLSSTYQIFGREKDEELNENSHPYQYFRFNSKCQTSSHGIVELPYELSEDEFLSSKDVDENLYTLISNIGSNEYICNGNCFCGEKDDISRRSAVSHTLTRTLTYLVATFSSTIAIKKATEYFSHECIKELEDHCPLTKIHSETGDCEEEGGINTVYEDENEAMDAMSKREWFCSGYCLQNTNLKSPEAISAAKEMGCEDLRTSTQLPKQIRVRNGVSDEDKALGFKVLREELKNEAQKEFEEYYLHNFCIMNTMREFDIFSDNNNNINNNEEEKKKKKTTVKETLCVGLGKEIGKEKNPTVVCVEVLGLDENICMGDEMYKNDGRLLQK